MSTGRTHSDDLGRLRDDGVDSWAPQHLTAAELRARGKGWPHIAEETGYSQSTVRDYVTIPGFADLVEHFRQELRDDRLDEHWQTGRLEALDALRNEAEAKKRTREELEARVIAGDVPPEMANDIIDCLSGDIVRAAKEYLRALGSTAAERHRRKLEAEQDVAADEDAQAGLRRDIQDELEEIDAVELANLYDKRFGTE